MTKHDSSDVLDAAIDDLMAGRSVPGADADPNLEPLLRIAAALSEMPSAGFKTQLAAALAAAATEVKPPVALGDLVRDLPTLRIAADTTESEANAAMRSIGWLNDRMLGVIRFSGQTPWERHPDGDELLHVLDGEVLITVLTDSGRHEIAARSGSVFVCPQGLWHRQYAPEGVTLLYGTPVETSEISFADDPRIVAA